MTGIWYVFPPRHSHTQFSSLSFLHGPEPQACRLMNALRSHRLKNGYAIFADSEQRLRPLSFLSRTGNLLQALRSCNFCVLIFSSENCLQKFSASSSAVFSRHSLTQFSNLSFLIRLQISFANLPTQISILISQICIFPSSLVYSIL